MEKSFADATPDDAAVARCLNPMGVCLPEDGCPVCFPESADAATNYVIPGEPLVEPEAPMTPDQLTMFALDALTVVLPDEAIRAQYAAAGETPSARKETYETTTIRQIVLYYDAGEYPEVLRLLANAMARTGTKTHTEAVTRLLREAEAR